MNRNTDTIAIEGFESGSTGEKVALPKEAPIFVNSPPPSTNMKAITWSAFGIAVAALILSLIVGGFMLFGTDDVVETSGVAGAKGQKGEQGQKGERGVTGIDGAEGIKGQKGEPDGDKGEKGDNGLTGPKGEKGEVGTDGTDGTKGQKGDKGDGSGNIQDGTDEGNTAYWDVKNSQWSETKDLVVNTPASRVEINTDLQISQPTVPVSAAATGAAGQVAWDNDYLYVCVATDTWKRVAISTW